MHELNSIIHPNDLHHDHSLEISAPDSYGSENLSNSPVGPVIHREPVHSSHHDHHPAVIQHLEPHLDFQGGHPHPELNIGIIAKAEEKCVDKIEYVEEIVQDEEIECHHTYEQKCQTTYTTDFESVQEEECDETFQKDCFIEYKKVAMNETVQVCHTPLVKDCNVPGPIECKTEYESMCETRYYDHWQYAKITSMFLKKNSL